MAKKVKVLIFDIETSPIVAHVWGLWDQTIGLNQIKSDWHVLSWAAKWLDAPATKIMYQDQRNAPRIDDDRRILKGIWSLLDEADVVIAQNGVAFDVKKLNARFILNGMKPPSPYKVIDTLRIAKKHFGFTSNKLEYMTAKLCGKYQKLKSKKFQGFELWKECLLGNKEAWDEMERYNKYDVLSLEELYHKLSPWAKSIDFNLYHDGTEFICNCGSEEFTRQGYAYTPTGKFQQYRCSQCGSWSRGKRNLLTKDKRSLAKVRA